MFSKTNLNLIIRGWQRNKLFSVIAILSLVVGLACSNLLIAFVANEWQISVGSPDKDRIFLLKSDNPMDEKNLEKTSFIIPALPPLLKERYPEVETYCRFQKANENVVFETESFKSDKILFLRSDNAVAHFFNIREIIGDLEKTLSSPGEAAITVSTARMIFGNEDVMGKTFLMSDNNRKDLYIITTLIDDSKTASFLKFDVLLPLDLDAYIGGVTFLKLNDKAASASVLLKMKEDGEILPRLTQSCQYYLQSMSDVYFDVSENQSSWGFLLKRDRSFLYISLLSAIAILLIACFNYINMYLVRAFKNEKNSGIQKIFGASNSQLRGQLLTETFLAVIISFLLSFLIIAMLLPIFNSLFNAHLSFLFFANKSVIAAYFVLILFLIFVPSLYLFFRIKTASPGELLKPGSTNFKAKFANWMVSLQFIISIVLIIVSLVYSKQLGFITKTANIDGDIIEINGSGMSSAALQTFKNEACKLIGVQAGTLSGSNFLSPWIVLGDDNVPIVQYSFDSGFLHTHNFNLTEGEGFTETQTRESKKVIVNQAFIDKFEIDEPIGKLLPTSDKSYIINGVVADFYSEAFSKRVKPTVIHPLNITNEDGFQVLQLRLDGDLIASTIDELKKVWQATFPDKIFNFTFIRDEFNQFHNNYSRVASIVGFFTIISIFLTGFGLFGMTWYSVERRTKEIGIRKVNGAKVSEVMTMLNKDFVKWVAIAFIIATPIAWYAMNKWLENFAYKTNLSWWIFALAGLLALGVALLTISFQTWRAATRNPVEALRDE